MVGRTVTRADLSAAVYQPGDVAEDGTGKNSPYSAALAEAMGIAGVPVELAFKRVRGSVMQATGNRQVPWESSSLIGNFYFAQTTLVSPPPHQPVEKASTSPTLGIYPAKPRFGETFRDCA